MDIPTVYWCSKADTKERKIKGISGEALNMLSYKRDGRATATHINGETTRCFEAKERSDRQDEILEVMRRAVCLPTPRSEGVTIQEVSQVAIDLGKKRLDCD